jgi:hypothetical protein
MSKGPLNYTTTISATKTASECVARLAEHGASAIGITYADKKPTGITFKIETVHGERQFSLPVNTDGTFKALLKANRRGDIAPRYSTSEQAERVAWRVIKDWLEAQLALIEAGIADMAEVMLPYLHVAPGVTLYRAYLENEQLSITAGDSS